MVLVMALRSAGRPRGTIQDPSPSLVWHKEASRCVRGSVGLEDHGMLQWRSRWLATVDRRWLPLTSGSTMVLVMALRSAGRPRGTIQVVTRGILIIGCQICRLSGIAVQEILHDVVGTSRYHCKVLRSFPVERIEQGNE
nr:hypothetical protein [Tanacetum cinerariifolium]